MGNTAIRFEFTNCNSPCGFGRLTRFSFCGCRSIQYANSRAKYAAGGEKVLEVVGGSGFAVAVLSEIAGPVFTIERIGRLAERLVVAPKSAPLALNFGPDTSQNLTVAGAVDALSRALGVERGWVAAAEPPPKEDTQLKLDASAAAATLGWRPRLDIAETIAWTAEWYAGWQAGKHPAAGSHAGFLL